MKTELGPGCSYDWSTHLVDGAPVLVCVEHGGRDVTGNVYFNADLRDLAGGPCDCSAIAPAGGGVDDAAVAPGEGN